MKKYQEKRILHIDDLRSICISKGWYNNGTNKEYTRFLLHANSIENITTDYIQEIAKDIFDHSSFDIQIDIYDKQEIIENIMFELINKVCTTYISIV